ncbi:Multidrug resistance-associated protein 4 [Nymphon striatum]|nr:Multidrug resistance-associated protein 4 [Nymphon striatum]
MEPSHNALRGVTLITINYDKFAETKNVVLTKIVDYISKRFENIQKDEVLKSAQLLDPVLYQMLRINVAFETFGKEAVSTIAKQLAVPLQTAKFDAERVHAEWLDLKVFVKRNPVIRVKTFSAVWNDILSLHRARFPNMSLIGELVLVLPLNAACCERGFSQMKIIKSDWRSSMTPKTLDSLMRIVIDGPDIDTFDPSRSNFLSIEEYPSEYPSGMIQSLKEKMFIDSKYRPIVKLHEVSSSYGKNTENIVKNISFELNPGDYLCVIGEVGSGKTSLLKTILKEMVVNDGVIKVRGTIAYACQQSWIFSDTLKNNILFGSKFDHERYKNIIKACCLSMDICQMPDGDETIVGERGIKLSGGQRARVSLARALYYDADIYLLDDPLSAVDAEVGNHLYSQCIQGYLANKITILVTHQINFLRHAPNILSLRKVFKFVIIPKHYRYSKLLYELCCLLNSLYIFFIKLYMVDSIMVEIASLRSHLEDAKGQLVKLISKDRIHKPDTVKYLNKSMKVALAKLSNIEKSVSEGATVVKERPSQPTYANVVAKAVASHRSPPETIIVESQDADIKTAGQLQALVKDSVNLREAKIGVTNIRHAGTKLIIKTQNSVDKGTLVNLINNTLKAKNKRPIYGTYETLLEKFPNLKTFFTESFINPSTATKKIKGEQAIFKSKEVDGICKLDNIEEATSNSVSWKVYEDFFRAAGNPFLILLTSISLNIIYSLILLGFDYWIKIWTEFEDQKTSLPGNRSTSTEHLGFSFNSHFQNNQNSLIILSIICLISVLFSIPTIFFDIMFCLRAARKLHDRMFNKLLHAPIKFFNCHPIGEILNRFTKDIGEIDEYIPAGYQDFLQDTIKCIIMVLAVCFVAPYLFIVTILLGILAVFAAKIYARSYTTLKRAENITKSPVYTHVSITLDGLSTIRAYGALDRFRYQFNNLQDLNMATYHMYYSVQIWLALYAEYIGTLMICVVTIMPVIFHSASSASSIGFIISQLVHVSSAIQLRIRTALTLQSRFTSVERVMEYGAIHSEADRECAEENILPDNWPQIGSILAYNVSLAYNKNNFVLKDICFSIKGGQKVGVIGRTGAGKTSLVNALFRLEEPSGCLKIDGIDISKIGLHQLRKSISIIPQEPLLFKNTIRYNLDPFGSYSDAKLWSALESVELKSVVVHFPDQLDTTFTEGNNLSVGEQQLICLARAILKENKIIVLDEATSSVDVITDKIIQKTIRTKFKDFTVITIAHRIHTIIDADVIMVIDNGHIVEMGSPKNLIQNKDGHFYKTILETGSSAQLLIKQSLGGN